MDITSNFLTAGLALTAAVTCALIAAYYIKKRASPAPGRLLHNDLAYTDRTVTILINSRPGGRYITAITFPEADPGELETAIKSGASKLEGSAKVEIQSAAGLATRRQTAGGAGFHSFSGKGGKPEAEYILDSFNVPGDAPAGQIKMVVRILYVDSAMAEKFGPPRLRMEEI